ncbi:MAG: N-acetyltransferase [Phycisphaerales bacterium]|nr:MAG: N-acetyltransferase [Phycisphaerales bacterium]
MNAHHSTHAPSDNARAPLARVALDGGVRLAIAPGTGEAYDTLSRFHYLAGAPAVPAGVRVAIDADRALLAGVLVLAMPTLNGVWRNLAWPGRYASGDKRRCAARLNREVRCIARVIVDPRYRGLGVARALVRAYLDAPLTPATEAVAAMGSACGFFAAAGMTPYALPVHEGDARLMDALESREIEAALLGDRARQRKAAGDPLLVRELRRWARARTTTRAIAEASPALLAREAARRLSVRPVAYAHTACPGPGRVKEPIPCKDAPGAKDRALAASTIASSLAKPLPTTASPNPPSRAPRASSRTR